MQEEILKISHLSEKYNIIAFDTEFPGTVKFLQKLCDDDVPSLSRTTIRWSRTTWTPWNWSRSVSACVTKRGKSPKKDSSGNSTSSSTSERRLTIPTRSPCSRTAGSISIVWLRTAATTCSLQSSFYPRGLCSMRTSNGSASMAAMILPTSWKWWWTKTFQTRTRTSRARCKPIFPSFMTSSFWSMMWNRSETWVWEIWHPNSRYLIFIFILIVFFSKSLWIRWIKKGLNIKPEATPWPHCWCTWNY